MEQMKQLALYVETGRSEQALEQVCALLDAGFSVDTIVHDGLMAGLNEVGRKFASQEYFLPEMLTAARAMKRTEQMLSAVCGPIRPRYRQKVVLGTVKNDLHDIGKNLVRMAIENLGIEVIDLGVDVYAEQFVQAVEADEDVAFVGISALLTTTMPAMRDTVRALRRCRAAKRIRILVGGAPVTAEFAKKIGADLYTETAFEAAEAIRRMLEGDETE